MLDNDIRNKAYRLGRMSDIDTEDTGLLRRAMTEGVAEVVSMCGKYLWSKSHSSNNYLLDDCDMTIVLMMPMNFNLAGCASLGRMIHAYITAKVLADWCRYFSPNNMVTQQQLQEDARNRIRTILNGRTKVVRNVNEMVIVVGKANKSDKEKTV